MNLKHALNHPDEEIRTEAKAFLASYQAGRYTVSMMQSRAPRWLKENRVFQSYWDAKEQIKMLCRVAWRKIRPRKLNPERTQHDLE